MYTYMIFGSHDRNSIKLSPFIDYLLWARHCSAHVFPISYIPGFPLSRKINFSWKLKEMILLITLRHRSKWWCMVCIHNACPSLINESSARSELCSSSIPFMFIMEIFVTDIKRISHTLEVVFFYYNWNESIPNGICLHFESQR